MKAISGARLIVLAAVIGHLFPAIVQAAGEKALSSELDFRDCAIGTGAAKLLAQCASIQVPLHPNVANSSNKQMDTIELSVARIPARRQSAKTDAFTLLAGGPGQSAIESFPALAYAFRQIMRDRDVILVDQRGTGNSTPLRCPQAPDSPGMEFDPDTARLEQLAQECLDSLPRDPRLFSTSVAVQDLELLRKKLGISQWNLYGISYGTRVALHYLRRFPDNVRTLTLDAVVPPTVSLGTDIAPLAQRSLDLILNRCTATQGCFEAFGDLRGPTTELLASLQEQARTISYEDIATGQLTSMEFTNQHLAIVLRLMTYNSQTAAILPSMLHEAIVNDNFAPLARQAMLQTRSLSDSMATGMHHAVVCTEDIPYLAPAVRSGLAQGDGENVTQSYMGNTVVESLQASCANWPVGRIDDDFKEPILSSVPALILSGEADPITPPSYGDEVGKTLSNSLHLVNANQGHMQAPFGCMPVLLAQFIESADAQTLDTSCLERIRVLPFFVDANGPLP